ncbi:MAG: Gfo/Idh/MocA family oxidoreductase [Candidatus Omnitrophota bacterium]
MKIVIVGIGAIGSRHMNNLLELGHEIYAVDLNKDSLAKKSVSRAKAFTSLDEALEKKPDIAFICTYSNAHIGCAIQCAEAGCHLFIEKPLSCTLEGTQELVEIIKKKKLISMVGCNMRFHPALAHIQEVLSTHPDFAKKLWANMEFGYYLPFAKPDYQSSYMAHKDMGGNLIFDSIHELDYAAWFLGEPLEVLCVKGILSGLKIDTQDCVDMIIRFKSNIVCTVHMDYLQQGYTRRCKVVCEQGTIVWDFPFQKVGQVSVKDGKWDWKDMNVEIYYNQMYKDELKYFLECVNSKRDSMNSVEGSLTALKLAIAADKSSCSGKWEKIGGQG